VFSVCLAIFHGSGGSGWSNLLNQLQLEPKSCVLDELEAGLNLDRCEESSRIQDESVSIYSVSITILCHIDTKAW